MRTNLMQDNNQRTGTTVMTGKTGKKRRSTTTLFFNLYNFFQSFL